MIDELPVMMSVHAVQRAVDRCHARLNAGDSHIRPEDQSVARVILTVLSEELGTVVEEIEEAREDGRYWHVG